jgi:hypothetical protein
MKKNKPVYPEDIIEETLQNGIESAMKRFNIPRAAVVRDVKPFVDEIDGIPKYCMCEQSRLEGQAMFCSNCTKPISRIP